MQRLPVFFGYAGALPFFGFMLLSFLPQDRALEILHIGYMAIILSFLGGVHWVYGLHSGNKKQIAFSMLPSIIGFFFVGAALYGDTTMPLAGGACLFVLMYYADKRWLPASSLPENYFSFRLTLTTFVSTSLIISFIARFL